jgi:hypothetical protein
MAFMCFVRLAGSRFYDKNGIAFSEHVCFSRLISVALFFFLFLSFGVCERRRKEYLFAFLCSVSLGPKKLEPAIHLHCVLGIQFDSSISLLRSIHLP